MFLNKSIRMQYIIPVVNLPIVKSDNRAGNPSVMEEIAILGLVLPELVFTTSTLLISCHFHRQITCSSPPLKTHCGK